MKNKIAKSFVRSSKLKEQIKTKVRSTLRLKLKNDVPNEDSGLRKKIEARLGCTVFVKPQRVWLNLKNKYLNAVWGSEELGMPAGKMYHLAGKKHVAKTAQAAYIAGLAQREHNAFVIWIDAENSYDRPWMKRLGTKLSENYFYLVYPKVLTRNKAKKKGKKTLAAGKPFLQSAEYLFQEAEEVVTLIKEEYPDRPIFIVLDSVANLQTEMAVDLGLTDQNMRSKQDRAQFLSMALPRWVSLCKNYTMWFVLINQIRTNPTAMFTNPEYSPGGAAMDHNCHVMISMRRKGKGLEGEGDSLRIGGYMVNEKNKAGGGSEQSRTCLYKVELNKPHRKMWTFAKLKKKKAEVPA